MKLKEIYRSDQYYSVCECDRVEGLVIAVVCGGIGMYTRIVELTRSEIGEFRKRGNLDNLARRIAGGEAELLQRELLPASPDEPIEYF